MKPFASHSLGTDVLGQDSNRAILIRLRDPGAIVKSQSSVAALAQGLAPATVETKVYEAARDELAKSLSEKGIAADVTLVQPKAFTSDVDASHFWSDVAYAIGGMGVVASMWWLATRGRR